MKKKIFVILFLIISITIISIQMIRAEVTEETIGRVYQKMDTVNTVIESQDIKTGKTVSAGVTITYSQPATQTSNAIVHSSERALYCVLHGGRLTDPGDCFVEGANVTKESVTQGETLPLSGDPGFTTTTSETLCTYDDVEDKVAGKDGDYKLAYILAEFENNTDSKSEVQKAMWAILGQGEDNSISREARAYEKYKEELGDTFSSEYSITDQSVAMDSKNEEYILGPFSVKYVRGYANEGDRGKVEFGGIESITLYDQDGNEIDQNTWKIMYISENSDSKKSKDGDEDYGTNGLGGEFFEYPYSEEEFHIKLSRKGNENVRKISKIEFKFFDRNIISEYQILKGTYFEVTWTAKHDTFVCRPRTVMVRDGKKLVKKTIPCSHGEKNPHEVPSNYRLVATALNKKQSQTMAIVKKVKDTLTTYTPRIETPKVTPTPTNVQHDYPTVPDFGTPNWPSWPRWPIPDWPIPDYPIPDYPTPDWPTPIPTPTPPDTPTPTPTPDLDLTIRLSGVVWQDDATGKESKSDGLFGYKNDGTEEDGIKNVKVTLYKYGTTELAEAKQNPVYTDEHGAYYFTRVPMGKYDVEFEYNGMKYQTVKAYANGSIEEYINNPDNSEYAKCSKTEETEELRQSFNDKFYEITGAEGQTVTEGKSYGIAKDKNGNKTVDLEYKTENGVSTLITTEDGKEDGKVKSEYALTVKTSDMGIGYPFYERTVDKEKDKLIDNNTYEADYRYMYYINLGLKKRPEADFAVKQDVSKATLTINKKKFTYNYNSRANMDGFELTVKKSNNYNVLYNREIYKSDYNYRIDDYKNNTFNPVTGEEIKGKKSQDEELKVFVTYKMTVRNQSEIPSGTINELIDYFSNTYTLVDNDVVLDIEGTATTVAQKSYFETTSGLTGNVDWNIQNKSTSGLNVMTTNSLKDIILQSGEDINIYLTFIVNKDANRFVETGEKYNYFEINSYSTFANGATNKDKTLGQVDRDSAPGNMDPKDSETYEDDSDAAPTINIKLSEVKRELNGTAWEDNRKVKLSNGKNVGDGLMTSDENKVNGVIVQLVEKVQAADGNEYEYIWQEMKTGEMGYKYVNNNGYVIGSTEIGDVKGNKYSNIGLGEYLFQDYVPGNYIVRFKYGADESTILPNEKNNNISYNGQDYKSTAYNSGEDINAEWYDLSKDTNVRISDAKDNEARRLEVINNFKPMIFKNANILYYKDAESDYTKNLREFIEKTWMYADTAKINVQVEYNAVELNGQSEYSYYIKNIDFGLEQRPENKLELSKEIQGIKVTLANGETLIDTEQGIRKNVNWIKNKNNSKGKISIYMDQELMQGATVQVKYKITVENTGEVDTIGAGGNGVGTTYYTGKESNDDIVATNVDYVVDYVDNGLVFNPDINEGWSLVEKTEGLGNLSTLKDNGYLSNKISYKDTEGHDIAQIIVNNKFGRLKPTEKSSQNLVLTKVISASDDSLDLNYDNTAEIMKFTNDVGRKSNIPGNQDPSSANKEPDSDYTETIIITPPTGENRSTTYLLVGSAILAIIGISVYVIRKRKIIS